MKTCTQCDKPAWCRGLCRTHYNKQWSAANRDKKLANQRRYYEKRPDVTRNSALKKRFGITIEQYNELLDKQNGRCAVCRAEPTKTALAVDHCHESGLIRGLLCSPCNTALGLLRECPNRMNALREYINKFSWLK